MGDLGLEKGRRGGQRYRVELKKARRCGGTEGCLCRGGVRDGPKCIEAGWLATVCCVGERLMKRKGGGVVFDGVASVGSGGGGSGYGERCF